jgi:hypothetical protein
MDIFYPFIHKNKEKEKNKPIPLYVELVPPSPEKQETPTEDDNPGVIIIELF